MVTSTSLDNWREKTNLRSFNHLTLPEPKDDVASCAFSMWPGGKRNRARRFARAEPQSINPSEGKIMLYLCAKRLAIAENEINRITQKLKTKVILSKYGQ